MQLMLVVYLLPFLKNLLSPNVKVLGGENGSDQKTNYKFGL